MIKKNFNLMWRKIKRNKVFTLINIFGLSVGIAVFIIISMWIVNEYSYDKYNKNIDKIYRIEIGKSVYMVSAVAQTYKNEFSEIENAVRFAGMGSALISADEKSIMANDVIMADSTLFDIFTYEFISGNPQDALVAPFKIVLTESTSRTLFGDSDPVGKPVKINNQFEVIVSGVVKDVSKTHMPVDAIASFVTLGKVYSQPDFLHSFGTSQFPTYFIIRDGVDIAKLSEKMTAFTIELSKKYGGDEDGNECELVPLKDIYFHEVYFPRHLHGNLKFVYIFTLVSILTLVIACINFVNLTIAKSSCVEKEVGVKKVFGASQGQLFSQFLFESVILCIISSLVAFILIQIIIPQFNQLTGGTLALKNYLTPLYILYYFLIILIIGLLAGIYPAIKLSSYNPIQYFRKFGGKGINRSPFRTGLVIFQFTVSIILMLSVFIVIRQLNFMKDFPTGFNTENIIVFEMEGEIGDKKDVFKNDIKAIPNIKEVAFSSAAPGGVNNFEGFSYQGVSETKGIPVFTVDPSFLPLIGVKITEGRNFSWERPNDRYGVCILNREAVELFKIEKPVGKFLKHSFYLTTIPRKDIEIIGVIDDYHYLSPKDSVGPALFCYGDWYNTVSIKLNTGYINETLKRVEDVWNKYAPGFPFKYRFLDESYERQYRTEATLSKILVSFAFIAVLIACLGLLGLTSLLAQERTKEIGIRKVFGATSVLIIRLLSKDFLKWVIIAIVIGTPLSVYAMNQWLTNFAYHTSIKWWLIVMTSLMLVSVSLLTIIFHIVKVSRTNPINALKYE